MIDTILKYIILILPEGLYKQLILKFIIFIFKGRENYS